MSDNDEGLVYGTAARDAPVTRGDFERAIRNLNMSDLDLREAVLTLGARVIALTDELTRRIDGVEPEPAPPATPAAPPSATIEIAVAGALEATLASVHAADARSRTRVSLDLGASKYETPSPDIPCAELLPLCKARCCTLSFALSTEDLDEGVIRWDYGQPYLIRQRASDGYCVHNDPDSQACTVHQFRPRVCRSYDCRADPRVWVDFAQRIPAPPQQGVFTDKGAGTAFDLLDRARARQVAIRRETKVISETYADHAPCVGPRPRPRREPEPEPDA
jgi:Fe-S-cluster containining protein